MTLYNLLLQFPLGLSSPELASEACKPLRPAYAADLRDAALLAAGYKPSDMAKDSVKFTFNRWADGYLIRTWC
jgi:hypothetical protein